MHIQYLPKKWVLELNISIDLHVFISVYDIHMQMVLFLKRSDDILLWSNKQGPVVQSIVNELVSGQS